MAFLQGKIFTNASVNDVKVISWPRDIIRKTNTHVTVYPSARKKYHCPIIDILSFFLLSFIPSRFFLSFFKSEKMLKVDHPSTQ